eukprot:794676-Pleurochrysis_carterae.AAC.1
MCERGACAKPCAYGRSVGAAPNGAAGSDSCSEGIRGLLRACAVGGGRVCVRVCACEDARAEARARVRVSACACARVRVRVCACARACVRPWKPACAAVDTSDATRPIAANSTSVTWSHAISQERQTCVIWNSEVRVVGDGHSFGWKEVWRNAEAKNNRNAENRPERVRRTGKF